MPTPGAALADWEAIEPAVHAALAKQPITDLHTHCFAPKFGDSSDGTGQGLLLWGIDELVTYHYLIAEVYRVVPPSELPYETFWAMSKAEQADHIWKHLFVERSPISEACRGVLTTLNLLGLDPNEKTLEPYRKWFSEQTADTYVDKVMEVSGVRRITMTNEVFSEHERSLWLADATVGGDPRFAPVLRIDKLICDWPAALVDLNEGGYEVTEAFTDRTVSEARRWLGDWLDRMKAVYVAASLPPTFGFPSANEEGGGEASDHVLGKIVLPELAERGLAMALMIGSRRQINPSLRDAGDMCGKSDVVAVGNLCAAFPNNKFLVTMLARENQHELCVVARKFGNLMIFGCWWFLNNPSLIEEMTRMRMELLGTSFIPQHSDARILDQLIYKWEHSRRIIGKVLADKYADAVDAGLTLTEAMIERDAGLLLRDNFHTFIGR